MSKKIARGTRVELRCRLYDAEGERIEGAEEGEAIEYVQGDEDLPPALQAALEGQEAGATVRVALAEGEAFGPHDPALLVRVPRSELPDDVELVVGEFLPVGLEGAPEDLEDEEILFRIAEVGDEEVVLDANHPLAGEAVTFELDVLAAGDADQG